MIEPQVNPQRFNGLAKAIPGAEEAGTNLALLENHYAA
jgi:hypothetical protein